MDTVKEEQMPGMLFQDPSDSKLVLTNICEFAKMSKVPFHDL